MKVLMFLHSVNAGLTYVHAASFALVDDLAYELSGVVTTVQAESGGSYRGAPVYYIGDITETDGDILIFRKSLYTYTPNKRRFMTNSCRNVIFRRKR